MSSNNPPALIWKCDLPPREIIPDLIEWWLRLCAQSKDNWYAGMLQIEEVTVSDEDPFWGHTRAFLLGTKTPSMITSANTKTNTLVFYKEDAEGNLIVNPITNECIPDILHSQDIVIYRCLPISTIDNIKNSTTPEMLGTCINFL